MSEPRERSRPAASSKGRVRSMTGFGRGEACSGDLSVCVELSSVNRRQLDCVLTLPRELAGLEARLVDCIRQVVGRGHVKGSVRVTQPGLEGSGRQPCLNLDLARAQIDALRRAAKALNLPDLLDARDLAGLPDVLTLAAPALDTLDVWPVLEQASRAALVELDAMRLREGERLLRDVRRRFARLGRWVAAIARRAPKIAVRHRETLLRRLRSAALPIETDDPALLREVALFADRCDISEELIRLNSHLEQFEELVESAAPCGRPLDFLCQECFREINTIGSKAGDAAIIRDVIRFKAELEAVREQAQNIE